MTYREWLRGQKGRNDRIGDLARDAFQDRKWRGDTAESLMLRMEREVWPHDLSDNVIETYYLSTKEYALDGRGTLIP